jgi:hypothetical protein
MAGLGAPVRRALIVAISRYGETTGWRSIHAANDLAVMKAALAQQRFSVIDTLEDEAATRRGIEQAFREKLLGPARPGDVAVLHFSGHGQQITDDDGDELDGYDETLVPYDAPQQAGSGYEGELHLRDDTLDEWMTELRRRVGPQGQVVVFLDSCASGTPRGDGVPAGAIEQNLASRGGPRLGEPRPIGRKRGGPESSTGFGETARGVRAIAEDEGLAPYLVFSAARHDELAIETFGEDGKPIGSLSWSLGLELAASGPSTTYRDLFERIKERMGHRVPHEPQVEGGQDRLLWVDGAVRQEPFFEVRSARVGEIELNAGTLVGLLPGARIELHQAGSPEPRAETLLAAGEVVAAQPAAATVRLDRRVVGADFSRARAFLTRATYGNLALTVELRELPPAFERELRRRLAQALPAVRLVESGGEIRVAGGGRSATVLRAETAEEVTILPPHPLVESALDEVVAALGDSLRSRYLRRLKVRDPKFDVRFEMVPRLLRSTIDWRVGSVFGLRVYNLSDRPAYINVLDLTPDGKIRSYWPDPRTGERTEIPAKTSRLLPASYEMSEPEGEETILLVGTDEWIDFRPILSRAGVWSQGEAKGALGPFAPLFDLGSKGGCARRSVREAMSWCFWIPVSPAPPPEESCRSAAARRSVLPPRPRQAQVTMEPRDCAMAERSTAPGWLRWWCCPPPGPMSWRTRRPRQTRKPSALFHGRWPRPS